MERRERVSEMASAIEIQQPPAPFVGEVKKGCGVWLVLRECSNRSDNELVFPSTLYSARNLSKSCIIRVFITACDKAKIRGLTIHKLRHTFGMC